MRPHLKTPFAFREQGVAVLSAIVRAFVAVRRILPGQTDIKDQLRLIQECISEHDIQLGQIYNSIEHLLDEHVAQRTWESRERIGFKSKDK